VPAMGQVKCFFAIASRAIERERLAMATCAEYLFGSAAGARRAIRYNDVGA